MSLGDSIGSSLGRAIGAALSGGSSYASLVTNGVLAPYVTFTRADASSCATYFDSDGVMQIAAANIPRIDYDPSTLAMRGLLIEEARTNVLLWTGALASAPWATNGSGAVTAGFSDPSGGSTAFRIVTTTTAINSGIHNGGGMATGSVVADSVWLRGEAGGESVMFGDATNRTTVVLTTAWQRFSGVVTKGSAFFVIYSNNLAQTWYAWKPQTEVGAFPTSYIPTVAASVTRAADNGVLSTLATIGYNALEGTLYVEGYTALGIGASSINLVSLNDGTANELIALRHVTGGTTIDYTVVDGGVAQVDTAGTAVTAGASFKAAIAFKANDFAQSVNGGAAQTDASGTVPTVDRLTLGAFNGTIKNLRYYPRRLSDAELVALTA